jgi:integrase
MSEFFYCIPPDRGNQPGRMDRHRARSHEAMRAQPCRNSSRWVRPTPLRRRPIPAPFLTFQSSHRQPRVVIEPSAIFYPKAAVPLRFAELRIEGASSHSGRRTYITAAAKKIVEAGGSLRDVQELAGHTSLATTQRYIQGDTAAKRNVIKLI